MSLRKITNKQLFYSVFYESVGKEGYVATVPALPGCHTQGKTVEEAEKNIREAIELYVESLQKHQEEIPFEEKSFQGKVIIPIFLPA